MPYGLVARLRQKKRAMSRVSLIVVFRRWFVRFVPALNLEQSRLWATALWQWEPFSLMSV